jgi:hypothetical protein
MGTNESAEAARAVPVPPDALAAGLVAAEPVDDAELPQPARMPARTVSSTVRPSLFPLTPAGPRVPRGPRVRLDRHGFRSRPMWYPRPMKSVPRYSQ